MIVMLKHRAYRWIYVDNVETVETVDAVHSVATVSNVHSSKYLHFTHWTTAPSGPGPPHYRGFTITHTHTRQSIGLLWTSDQPDAETSA
jgi:hypothetical protein